MHPNPHRISKKRRTDIRDFLEQRDATCDQIARRFFPSDSPETARKKALGADINSICSKAHMRIRTHRTQQRDTLMPPLLWRYSSMNEQPTATSPRLQIAYRIGLAATSMRTRRNCPASFPERTGRDRKRGRNHTQMNETIPAEEIRAQVLWQFVTKTLTYPAKSTDNRVSRPRLSASVPQ